jgi:hypothetical protein
VYHVKDRILCDPICNKVNIKDFTTLIYTYIHWKINNLIFVVEYLRTKTVLPQCLVEKKENRKPEGSIV